MHRLEPGRAARKLPRVDRSHAACERLPVGPHDLDSVAGAIRDAFPEKIANANIAAARAAYDVVAAAAAIAA